MSTCWSRSASNGGKSAAVAFMCRRVFLLTALLFIVNAGASLPVSGRGSGSGTKCTRRRKHLQAKWTRLTGPRGAKRRDEAKKHEYKPPLQKQSRHYAWKLALSICIKFPTCASACARKQTGKKRRHPRSVWRRLSRSHRRHSKSRDLCLPHRLLEW